jgi:hypothetical protein
MSGVLVAGLTTAVGSRDELEIIVDRRRDGPTTNQPSIERRQRDHVARALERDGFAFVLVPTAEPSGSSKERALADRAFRPRGDVRAQARTPASGSSRGVWSE